MSSVSLSANDMIKMRPLSYQYTTTRYNQQDALIGGDGAIGDWLELILYRYHGFEKTQHNSSLLPCIERRKQDGFN
jgi:hypothetical protein